MCVLVLRLVLAACPCGVLRPRAPGLRPHVATTAAAGEEDGPPAMSEASIHSQLDHSQAATAAAAGEEEKAEATMAKQDRQAGAPARHHPTPSSSPEAGLPGLILCSLPPSPLCAGARHPDSLHGRGGGGRRGAAAAIRGDPDALGAHPIRRYPLHQVAGTTTHLTTLQASYTPTPVLPSPIISRGRSVSSVYTPSRSGWHDNTLDSFCSHG